MLWARDEWIPRYEAHRESETVTSVPSNGTGYLVSLVVADEMTLVRGTSRTSGFKLASVETVTNLVPRAYPWYLLVKISHNR